MAESLFEEVRGACSPAVWSRGVELTRADAVVGESASDDEVVFRVATPGVMVSPKVTLFPDDPDWDCECPSHQRVCEHVAAAVIAWKRSREQGHDLPTPRDPMGRVGYRFSRAHGALCLERVIVMEDRSVPLESSLAALASGVLDGPRFVAGPADLALDVDLGSHRRGRISPQQMPRLFRKLVHCSDLRLDGALVSVSTDPVLPVARLEERGGGFRLSVGPDPTVTESFSNGAALCCDVLRTVGESRLTGRERHELERGRFFGADQVAELVTEVLPSLRERIPVEVATSRLPDAVRQAPRVVVDVERREHTLSVLATLVYGDPPTARIDGGRLVHLQGPVPLRDDKAERREVRRLRELGLAPGVREEFHGAQAVAFNSRLDRWKGRVRGSGREHFTLAAPLVPRLSIEGADFDLAFESAFDPTGAIAGPARRADPGEVLRAWRAGESLVPLLEGGWSPLPGDWLERFGHRIAALLAAREPDGSLPRCCVPDLLELCEDLERPPPPEVEALRALAEGFERIPTVALPADLAVTLRPYQEAGVDWLVFLREAGMGALLADDMGLGKTIQSLCALKPRCLVVSPTSVLHNWAEEIRAHRPGLTCSIYHGPGRSLDPAADVTLTTYAILRLDARRLAGKRWETVILDEAQNIKNPDSQVAGAAFRLDAGFRLALTGTPVENRLEELWSQLHFVNRGLLGGRRDFAEQYANPIERGDAEAASRLRRRIRPFVLRRLKQEVAADLPPRTDMLLHCELSDAEREAYDAVRAATVNEVVRQLQSGGSVLAALEVLLRLRQAACHRGLLPGQEAGDSSKVRLLMEMLDEVLAEGHRALVFSQWTSMLDRVEPHLAAASVEHVRLDGATRDRAGVVQRFQREGGPPVMLVSLKAGGTGLNLTAADHIFLLDPWWNPAVEDQAADRAHRIGQERPVMVYRLVALDTVEERILALQERKRGLADVALGEADRATGLTREDLLELLG